MTNEQILEEIEKLNWDDVWEALKKNLIDTVAFCFLYPQFVRLFITDVMLELAFVKDNEDKAAYYGRGGILTNYNMAVGYKTAHNLTTKYMDGIYREYTEMFPKILPPVAQGYMSPIINTSTTVAGVTVTGIIPGKMDELGIEEADLMRTQFGRDYLALRKKCQPFMYKCN